MLVYNDKFFAFEAYLKMPEYTEAKCCDSTIKYGIFQKMNIELKYNFI